MPGGVPLLVQATFRRFLLDSEPLVVNGQTLEERLQLYLLLVEQGLGRLQELAD